MQQMNNSNRIEWLDAMRGFTMILVVAYHVAHISFGVTDKYSSVQPLLVLFRMPLFFFVSGFLAYKAKAVWTGRYLLSLSWKKMKVQVIPAFIFLCVSILLLHKSFPTTFVSDMKSPTKGGYWFTWVLLHMFLIYYLFSYCEAKLRALAKRQHWRSSLSWLPIASLWLIFLSLYAINYMPPVMKLIPPDTQAFLRHSSLIQTAIYMHFFLFGNIVHRYWSKCQRLMDTSWFFPTVAIVAFISAGDFLQWHKLRLMWANIPHTLASYSLLMIVVMTFRHYGTHFTDSTLMGRSLKYIGTRTLDIYLIHFLLLPRLPQVGKWLNANHPNFVIDATLSLSLAIIVIAFCLLISNILRQNAFLREYLFGRK